MIVITGARGFIGSNLVNALNDLEKNDLILVDELQKKSKSINLKKSSFKQLIHRDDFISWFSENYSKISFVFHLGARTDTTEQNIEIFNQLNLNYSKKLFKLCAKHKIPFLYASSAATYGDGKKGYDDSLKASELSALNPYGESKLAFDRFVEEQAKKPPFWVGLKFFNVYGPNENHKGRMASVIFHAYNKIKQTGEMQLFESHKESVADGEQKRDFIFVEDIVRVCLFFYDTQSHSGIYNLGTGKARTFNDLARAVFKALDKHPIISYIPTPIDIRASYQYFTEAKMGKLRKVGYTKDFVSLEDGVAKYVSKLSADE